MGDHLNYSNLLLDDVDNKLQITLNLSTPSIETQWATKHSSGISEIEYCTDQKYDQITLDNFKKDILLEKKPSPVQGR